ncbi:unnamed protein product [Effrenium voratum]|nr:unnamed protein product [Effrenium voratum]
MTWGYNCNLYWCEANPDVDQTEAGVCHCWRKHVDPGCTSSVATVSTKIVAPRKLVAEDVQGPLGDYLANEVGMTITASQRENMQRSSVLAPVVTEEWERGSKEVREVTEVVTELNRGTESSCGWQDMCFCSSWSCKMIGDNWERVDEIVIPTLNSTRRLRKTLEPEPAAAAASLTASEAPRLLQMLSASELTVAPQNRAAIEIVFGITVTASSLLLGEVDLENGWVFSEMHQVSQPWAQRNMYSFCTNFPKELRVVERRCWMEDFRTYLLDRGDRFPIVSSQFQEQIIPFAQSWLTGMHSTKDYLWIRDGEVKASYYTISADFHSYSDTQSALKYKDLWDEHLWLS